MVCSGADQWLSVTYCTIQAGGLRILKTSTALDRSLTYLGMNDILSLHKSIADVEQEE